jgi:hypothetical protein
MSKRALAVVALIASAHAAHADSDLPERSETVATSLSVAGTLVPIAMMVPVASAVFDGPIQLGDRATIGLLVAGGAGLVIGPSLGNAYAGHPLTKGLALRAGGAALFALGTGSLVSTLFDGSNDPAMPLALCLTGVGLVVAGAVSDIASAGDDARRFNARHALQLAPTVIGQSGSRTPGLVVAGTF